MDRRGIEPRFPACKAGVVPLDQQPEKKCSEKEVFSVQENVFTVLSELKIQIQIFDSKLQSQAFPEH